MKPNIPQPGCFIRRVLQLAILPTPLFIFACVSNFFISSASAQLLPAPSISSVFPTNMPPLNDNQPLTINGSQFQIGATLTFVPPEGGTIASTANKLNFDSSSQITYQINNLSDSGPWKVKVNNPDGQSSDTASFTVTVGCSFTDTYPHPTANIFNPDSTSDPTTIDPWNFYNRECTSYVAWKLNEAAGTTASPYFFTNHMQGEHWGNASNWSVNAVALGYTTNTTPAIGAIAQWNAGEPGAGTFGHVAYVEAMNSDDGTVNVSEYNYPSEYNKYLGHTFGIRCRVTPPRFLHIHDDRINDPGLGGGGLSITNAKLTGSTFTLTLSGPTKVNTTYVLQFKSFLTTNMVWTSIQTNIGNNAELILTDTGATGLSGFYRILVQPD